MIELVLLLALSAIVGFILISLIVLLIRARQVRKKPKSLYYFADTDIEDNECFN